MSKRITWTRRASTFAGLVNGSHLFTVSYSFSSGHTYVLKTSLPVRIKNDLSNEADVLKDRAERVLEQTMSRWGFVPREDLELVGDGSMDGEPGS